jgi:CHRD domain
MRKTIVLTVVLTAAASAAVFAAAVWAVTSATAAHKDLGQSFGVGETAQMSGSVEVPPGDPDGSGTALIRLNVAEGLVCFKWSVQGVDPLSAGHIHHGAAGVAGPVVVPLVPPAAATGTSKGCVSADPALIQDIITNPSQYYVNVHNAQFPAGALRGQLTALKETPVKPKVIVRTKIVRVHDCKKVKKHK